MIARKDLQGKGLGTQVLCTFLWYIITHLTEIVGEFGRSAKKGEWQNKLKYLRVKIDAENAKSIKLFERVGFRKVSEEPNYFGELELRLGVTGKEYKELMEKVKNAKIALYRPPAEDRLEQPS
jgi:ribosomal protein S18 acetylase RimI-like enzyme